jgi:hypothetical protein
MNEQRPKWKADTEAKPEKVTGSFEIDYESRAYSYDDLLAAWVAGRDNFRKHGDGDEDGDSPDFRTWIKGHWDKSKSC